MRINAPWLRKPSLQKLLAALACCGHEARAVGGAVRDALAGRTVGDTDVATTALPETVMAAAAAHGFGVHPTGLAHGTVTVIVDGDSYEVTTLRRDVETDGRRAVVAFTTVWEEDAQRRDFTINAIYADANGALFDPVGGVTDLEAGRVRFIGEAAQRIREDYLRILRFLRFSAEFAGGVLDPAGVQASVALKDGLAQLSAERVWGELKKLLLAPHCARVVLEAERLGLLGDVLGARTHAAVLARLIEIETSLGVQGDVVGRLAALTSREDHDAIARRLRLSRAEASDLATANANLPGLRSDTCEHAGRIAIYGLGREGFARALRVSWARSGAPASEERWRERLSLADRFSPPRLPFGGADVVALGIAAGPAVGEILRRFEAWWVDADFPTDSALVTEKLRALAVQG